LILGQASEKSLNEKIGEKYFGDNNVEIEFSSLQVSDLKKKLFHREIIKDMFRFSKYWRI
jgi:hypothetical protein